MTVPSLSRLVVALAAAVLLAACRGDNADGPESTPAPGSPAGATQSADGNWFTNPGFEEGDEPWISLNPGEPGAGGFVVSQDFAHSGTSSALLRMRDPPEAEGAKVYYLVQEIAPGELPQTVRGYYRVENWVKNTPRQYLQFVVIAFNTDNFPADVSNYQVRYLLAGTASAPFRIDNAFFVFLGRDEPVQDEWVPFEANIRDDFQRLWGKIPEGFDKLRILFEVRWDGKVSGDGIAEADVYYDDLYIGPATQP
jgi:hypothetical protein